MLYRVVEQCSSDLQVSDFCSLYSVLLFADSVFSSLTFDQLYIDVQHYYYWRIKFYGDSLEDSVFSVVFTNS